jgi:hypothetical protein
MVLLVILRLMHCLAIVVGDSMINDHDIMALQLSGAAQVFVRALLYCCVFASRPFSLSKFHALNTCNNLKFC